MVFTRGEGGWREVEESKRVKYMVTEGDWLWVVRIQYTSDVSLWFWFAFPWWLLVLSIFSCFYWPFTSFLLINIYSDPLFTFNLGHLYFYCWVLRHSTYKSSISYVICKSFLPFCGLSFHFCVSILWSTSFYFWWCAMLLVLLVAYLWNYCLIQSHEDLCLFYFESFTVSAFTFRYLVHFELIFVYCMR